MSIGILLHAVANWKIPQPLWETVWKFLRRLVLFLPHNHTKEVISLLGVTQENESRRPKQDL